MFQTVTCHIIHVCVFRCQDEPCSCWLKSSVSRFSTSTRWILACSITQTSCQEYRSSDSSCVSWATTSSSAAVTWANKSSPGVCAWLCFCLVDCCCCSMMWICMLQTSAEDVFTGEQWRVQCAGPAAGIYIRTGTSLQRAVLETIQSDGLLRSVIIFRKWLLMSSTLQLCVSLCHTDSRWALWILPAVSDSVRLKARAPLWPLHPEGLHLSNLQYGRHHLPLSVRQHVQVIEQHFSLQFLSRAKVV